MTQELTQMGNAQVFLRKTEGRHYIEKLNASDVELLFYLQIAPQMSTLGVNTPAVYLCDTDNRVLQLEYIPHSVSLEELQDDPRCFRQLTAVHHFSLRPEHPKRLHDWKAQHTFQALEHLQLSGQSEAQLLKLREQSEPLFSPLACLSGDSNAGNWGKRDNGDLVLFDWERLGQGSPAIDLAPLVKGMGNITAYKAITNRYLAHTSLLTQETLIKHLILAKAWIVVEVVNILKDRQKPDCDHYLNWFRQVLPDWLNLAA
ncbi:phosphotransferase [Photobacterium halotolerans]|nr:phosphotransferase [Photobacterium halotolerans]